MSGFLFKYGTREVLSIVNHPTEGAGLWENEFENLKARVVQSNLLSLIEEFKIILLGL